MSNVPAVSVIIPAYNRSELIGETLRSVHRQTHRPIELVVVDDGSSDGTGSVVEAFRAANEEADFQVKLVRQRNAGVGAARNAGLALATGAYVQFLDSDDILLPQKIAVQVELLEERGTAGYGWCNTVQLDADGRVGAIIGSPMADADAEIATHHWHISGLLLRAGRLAAIGPFAVDLPINEDWEFAARVKAVCGTGVYSPEALTEYRIHAGQQIVKGGAGQFCLAREKSIQMVRSFLQNRGRLTTGARRSLAELMLRNALGSWVSLSKADTLRQARSVAAWLDGSAGLLGAGLFALVWVTPHTLAPPLATAGARAGLLARRLARSRRKAAA